MKLSVNAERINQLLWNALLFTPKGGAVEGKIFFSVKDQELFVFACDDFIVVRDKVTLVTGKSTLEHKQFALPIAAVKDMEAETRKAKGDVEVQLDAGQFSLDGEGMAVVQHQTEHPSQVWGDLVELLNSAERFEDGATASTFYLNPDRLKQIPRMKIEGHMPKDKQDQPLCFRYGSLNDQVMLAFKLGPSVAGLITSMDESVLRGRGVVVWDFEFLSEAIAHSAAGTVKEIDKVTLTADDVPWDEDGPTNIDITQGVRANDWKPLRVEYTDPVDPTVVPDHVDADEHGRYGF